jgi:hypothetical protein
MISTLLGWNRRENLLSIGPIIHGARSDTMPHLSITLMIKDWANRPIDGKLLANE